MTNKICIIFNDLKLIAEIESNLVQDEIDGDTYFFWEIKTIHLNGLFKIGNFISVDGKTDLNIKEVCVIY
jgi:hypothetical protein